MFATMRYEGLPKGQARSRPLSDEAMAGRGHGPSAWARRAAPCCGSPVSASARVRFGARSHGREPGARSTVRSRSSWARSASHSWRKRAVRLSRADAPVAIEGDGVELRMQEIGGGIYHGVRARARRGRLQASAHGTSRRPLSVPALGLPAQGSPQDALRLIACVLMCSCAAMIGASGCSAPDSAR